MQAVKISRSSLRSWAIGQLKTTQGGLCLVCKKPISLQVMGNKSDYVVDHCHETGIIRGVLHRSCNASLGKIDNAVGRWGAKSMKYEDIIPYLRNVLEYYDNCQANPMKVIYPDHKTPEQKADRARVKRNTAAAMRRAKMKVAKETQHEN